MTREIINSIFDLKLIISAIFFLNIFFINIQIFYTLLEYFKCFKETTEFHRKILYVYNIH